MKPPPLLRDWPNLYDDPVLVVALWRRGRRGFPVLVRHPRPELELGDRDSDDVEPSPQPTTSEPPAWWEQPYAGGPMVPVDGFPRAMYPPDAASQGKQPSVDGPDVIAYKRTVSRLGRWPWGTFDDSYSNGFAHGRSGNVGETGVAGVQRQGNVDPDTGWIGEATFNLLRSARVPEGLPHAGDMAMDATSANMIDEAYQRFVVGPPVGIDDVRAAVASYCEQTIRAAAKWHYDQIRAMRSLGDPPANGGTSDCSEHATCSYYHAKQQTGVAVPDPNGNGYNGYGWTGELIDNPRVSAPYQIGDLAIYGPSSSNTEHVCTCYLAGSASTSEWCSNGSESAPYAVELHYRSDLICVVRPGLMP